MKNYGLIGTPLSHSFSKKYFTEKFIKLDISDRFSYENFELDTIEGFQKLITSNHNLLGLNVTAPYKTQVIKFLDVVYGAAREINAVNTIRIDRNSDGSVNSVSGFNTDITGFIKSISPILMPYHKSALILGTGGASKAVEWALNSLSIQFRKISGTGKPGCLSYEELNASIIENFPVIINTTPLGTYPDIESCPPIPYRFLSPRNLLFDLVYNPEESTFLNEGKKAGAIVRNGYEMLTIQAEEAWKIWNE